MPCIVILVEALSLIMSKLGRAAGQVVPGRFPIPEPVSSVHLHHDEGRRISAVAVRQGKCRRRDLEDCDSVSEGESEIAMFSVPPRSASRFSQAALVCLLALSGLTFTRAATVPSPILLGGGPTRAGGSAAGELAVFPFLPVAAKHTGAAVLIVPETGFSGNSVEGPSLVLAQWLAERGLASFVLRYAAA